jgi:hypothetical protein
VTIHGIAVFCHGYTGGDRARNRKRAEETTSLSPLSTSAVFLSVTIPCFLPGNKDVVMVKILREDTGGDRKIPNWAYVIVHDFLLAEGFIANYSK